MAKGENMMRYCFTLLLLSSLAFPADKNEWQNGRLVSASREHWEKPYTTTDAQTGATSLHTWGHNTFYVVVDDGEYSYFAERTLSWRWQHDPLFTENAPVKFKLEGKDNFTIQDERGKEFKMKLVKRRKDDAAPAH